MDENNKCLYKCESIIDANEYRKMVKYFPKKMYWHLVKSGTSRNLIIVAIVAIITQELAFAALWFAIWQIILMIEYRVRLGHYAEKIFDVLKKNGSIDTKLETEFYEDHFIRKGETISFNIKYSNISRCVETDTNIYLEDGVKIAVTIFPKDTCGVEVQDFIRKTFTNYENHMQGKTKVKKEKREKKNNPYLIKLVLLVLFIASIASLWGALYSVSLVNTLIPQYGFNFTKNLWVFWCWLPVPISSIILGKKYKKEGFKCTKNIVAGYIMAVLLFMYGAFVFFPTHEQDYSKINEYKEIINLELPSNGVLEIQDWDAYIDEDITEYVTINAYYAEEDVTLLEKSIENNPNWILSNEITSDLKVFIPILLQGADSAYYSIYNQTTNEYNTIPEESGDYKIYAMRYDKVNKKLEIHEFRIAYSK